MDIDNYESAKNELIYRADYLISLFAALNNFFTQFNMNKSEYSSVILSIHKIVNNLPNLNSVEEGKIELDTIEAKYKLMLIFIQNKITIDGYADLDNFSEKQRKQIQVNTKELIALVRHSNSDPGFFAAFDGLSKLQFYRDLTDSKANTALDRAIAKTVRDVLHDSNNTLPLSSYADKSKKVSFLDQVFAFDPPLRSDQEASTEFSFSNYAEGGPTFYVSERVKKDNLNLLEVLFKTAQFINDKVNIVEDHANFQQLQTKFLLAQQQFNLGCAQLLTSFDIDFDAVNKNVSTNLTVSNYDNYQWFDLFCRKKDAEDNADKFKATMGAILIKEPGFGPWATQTTKELNRAIVKIGKLSELEEYLFDKVTKKLKR